MICSIFKTFDGTFNGKCIYFLMENGNMIYLGKTDNLKIRIKNHVFKRKIKFDSVKFIQIDKNFKFNWHEIKLIQFFQPVSNIKDNPMYYHLDPLRQRRGVLKK